MTVEPIIGLSLALLGRTCALIGNLVPGMPLALAGMLLGAVRTFALCVTMLVLFATNVIYRPVH